ncbi:MAG: hypothetical protein FJX77_05095 [Armatimonadetes bacterium]|nr:hypothetical protein [Armatimonadota bacterium]
MADQRRRGGRGRSGRGGRIPRKGDGNGPGYAGEESFTSFPLDLAEPVSAPSVLDPAAVLNVLDQTLLRERRQARSIRLLAEGSQDSALRDLRVQVERHRDVLEQLRRDLGVEAPVAADEAGGGADPDDFWSAVAVQRLARLGWKTLQTAAYAAGDARVDRVVRSVLREKEWHGEILEGFALRQSAQSLFREPEE